ncbi:MAG: serine hydrolase domain-containing protein, partial [Gammaproteobacteria bacterium]
FFARSIPGRGMTLFLAVWLAVTVHAQELPRAAPEDVGLSAERLARLDTAMQAYVDDKKLAGAVTLIARHGRVAHLRAFGKASIEKGAPMQADSLFRIFSMTKPITSVALLMLLEEGGFQLSDPAEMYIPAFKDLKVMDKVDEGGHMVLVDQARKMTIHDLFRHTAGLSYGFGNTLVDEAYRKAGVNGLEPIKLEDLVAGLGTAPLLYQPGTRWVYSYAHDVQAYLVEHFSGMKFDDFLRKRLFEPLGMEDTSFGLPREKLPRLTSMYAPVGYKNELVSFAPIQPGIAPIETPENSPYLNGGDFPAGGSGLVSSAEDYFRFAQMLLNVGEFNGRRVLSRKTVELMTRNHLPPGVTGTFSPGGGYGLGVSVLFDLVASGNLGSEDQFGWSGAASTTVIIDPREDMVSILMVQFRPANLSLWRQFQTLAYQAISD